jgi:hypothetical protein
MSSDNCFFCKQEFYYKQISPMMQVHTKCENCLTDNFYSLVDNLTYIDLILNIKNLKYHACWTLFNNKLYNFYLQQNGTLIIKDTKMLITPQNLLSKIPLLLTFQ